MNKFVAIIVGVILIGGVFLYLNISQYNSVNSNVESIVPTFSKEDAQLSNEGRSADETEVDQATTPLLEEPQIEDVLNETKKQKPVQTENVIETQIPTVGSGPSLLSFEKVPGSAVYSVSLSSTVEPEQIPFRLKTNIGENNLSEYQLCFTILDDGVRASETDCTVLQENMDYDAKIGLSFLGLAPWPMLAGYISPGTHQLEILATVIEADKSVAYKISGDTSPGLNILRHNAVESVSSGIFTYVVTE